MNQYIILDDTKYDILCINLIRDTCVPKEQTHVFRKSYTVGSVRFYNFIQIKPLKTHKTIPAAFMMENNKAIA